MRKSSEGAPLAAWQLPLIVAAISIAIVGGFFLGGPGLGMAVGALAASSIVVMAARKPPRRAIVPPSAHDLRRHLLVVLQAPLGQAAAVDALIAAARPAAADVFAPEILLLAPCPSRFLDRWASDVGPARRRAQGSLVHAAAILAAAGVEAGARTGDEDLVQTIEDALWSFPATEVVLVDGKEAGLSEDPRVADLRARLAVPLRLTSGRTAALPGATAPLGSRESGLEDHQGEDRHDQRRRGVVDDSRGRVVHQDA